MLALLADPAFQDECCQIAQGATFRIAAFSNRLIGGVGDGDAESLGCFADGFPCIILVSKHPQVAAHIYCCILRRLVYLPK